MTIRHYSNRESVERIYRTFRGESMDDAPDSLPLPRYSMDEALSRLAELLNNSLPGEVASLPSSVIVSADSIRDASTTQDGVVELATNAEAQGGVDSVRAVTPAALLYALQNGVGRVRFGSGANYVEINQNGNFYLTGTATMWDDLRIASTSTKLGGSKDPGFSAFKTDGGSSQGVFLYWFDDTSEEELYFAAQLPHGYLLNSTLSPHVHWTPSSGGTGTVSWGLEYSAANITGTFPNTTLIYGNGRIPNDVTLVAGKHYLTELPGITGSVYGFNSPSAMLVCRVFRDATASGLGDSYNHDAGLLEIDFHYEIDSFGSNTEYQK